MNRLIKYFAEQGLFANLVSVALIVIGIYSALHLQRETFPNVNFDIVQIMTLYPGASAEETERLITSPLEQDLKEVEGIKKMLSASVEGRSLIIMQVDPDQISDIEVKSDAQDIVERWRGLPDGAEDPVVTILNSKQRPVVEVSIAGDVAEDVLRQEAKNYEKYIETLRDVARIEFTGLRDFEVQVEADPRSLSRYHLSLEDLIISLKTQNISIPGGLIEPSNASEQEIILRTVGEFNNVGDIKETVIRSNEVGKSIRISDVATVTKGFVKREILNRTNGRPAINLTVFQKEKGDTIRMVDDVREMVKSKSQALPPGVSVSLINDTSYWVRRRLRVLTNNLGIGLILVLGFLSLLLPRKVALITSFGIPFSFLGTIIVFHFFGISLNLISMMGLIIVVGMLVDDAVVVTENATRLMQEKGLPPMEAAVLGTQQMWKPITASVFTTMFAFIPLMSMSGIMGKFMKFIPMAVIVALAISLYECYFVLPHHVGYWMKRKKSDGTTKLRWIERYWKNKFLPGYLWLLKLALQYRYVVVLLGFVLIGATGYILKNHMKMVIFPPGQIEFFMINIKTPIGTTLVETLKVVEPIEAIVAQLPEDEMTDYVTMVGRQNKETMMDLTPKRGHHFSQVIVFLKPILDRERSVLDIIADLRSKIEQPERIESIRFVRPRGGPPVGKALNVGVRGSDFKEIMAAISQLEKFINDIPGVSDVENSHSLGKLEYQLRINGAEAKAAELSVAIIGQAVRASYEGIVATTIRGLEEEIDVRVSLPNQDKTARLLMSQVKISNRRGNIIPLAQVAKLKITQGIEVYEHENNERQVSVTGDLDTKIISATEMAEKIKREILPALKKQHSNLSFFFGGENEDTKESLETLKRAFLLAIFGIFMILVMTFQNLTQPLMVLITVPLGLISTIWTFFVHGQPISFLGMIGAVALGGVIVNNAIVFMDTVNQKRKEGLNSYDSLVETGRDRLRPIFLTTVTTGCGVLPTAYGVGGLDPFVVPIALALGWGIFIGSGLTAIVFPVSLQILEDIKSMISSLRSV